jgi:hypothetical protein
MAQPNDSLSAADLKLVAAGGLVREDVLEKIYSISPTETPFLDMAGGGTYDNPYAEWTQDDLAATTLASAAIDGQDVAPITVASGARVGNHGQLSYMGVNVSEVALNTDNIGRSDEMGYQTTKRINELQNNIEASALSAQASVADNGSTVAGLTGGFDAWLETNVNVGAGGAPGGFNATTKIVDAPTDGTARGLTWTMVSDAIEAAYLAGAKPTKLLSVPGLTKRLAKYLFTTPYAAAPTANISGQGEGVAQTSQGYIDTLRTDFGYTMQIVPCRNQQTYGDPAACTLFGISPEFVEIPRMWGTKLQPLAKLGLYERKLISTHWMVRVLLEKAHFAIRDLDPTEDVVA